MALYINYHSGIYFYIFAYINNLFNKKKSFKHKNYYINFYNSVSFDD